MAASLSQGARANSPAERFQLVRELGARAVPVWAAVEASANARARLVVVQRVLRAKSTDEEIAAWTDAARRLATLEHPNVARTREVVTRQDDVLVVGDYVDGARWSEISSSSSPPPLELALRVILDLLVGLSALHNLRDAKRQPLNLIHGELTPECVLVGLDGVARLVDVQRLRSGASGATEAAPYLAPEVLLAGDTADARADIFSVGVLLWEALAAKPLFPGSTASAIVTQVLSGQVPRATLAATHAWAAPLVDAAAKALSAEPEGRFGSAATFAAEIRRVAAAKIAPSTRVAALVRTVFGDGIRARRQALEPRGALQSSTDEPTGEKVDPKAGTASGSPMQHAPPAFVPPATASAADASPRPISPMSASPKPTLPTQAVPPPALRAPPPPLPAATTRQAPAPDRLLRGPPPIPSLGVRPPPSPDAKASPLGVPPPPAPPIRSVPPPLKPPPLPVGAAGAGSAKTKSATPLPPLPPKTAEPESESVPHDAATATVTPISVTSPEKRSKSRRALVVGIVVASFGVASAAFVWRLGPTRGKDAGPSSNATALSSAPVQTETPTSEPEHAGPTTQAPPDPSPPPEPSASAPAAVVAAPVVAVPVAAPVETPSAVQAPAPPIAATPASPRPVSKHKYDPEGI